MQNVELVWSRIADADRLDLEVSVKSLVRPRAFGGSSLVRDYLDGVPAARPFYAGSPFQLETYRNKLAEVNARFDREARERMARAVRPTTENARLRLQRFVEEGGAVITTGQQAGFLTGPLYTIYKAMSAVALARWLEERLDVIVLPVFWIASEDHDWEEVRQTTLVDRLGRLRDFTLTGDETRALPMSERVLDGDLESLLAEVGQFIGEDRHSNDQVRRVLDAYRRPGRTMGEAFVETMGVVFGEVDVLITDAADPVVKEASAWVLRQALEEAERHEEVLVERSRQLAEAGYETQVGVMERATNVFLRTDAGRERLYRRGADFGIRDRGPEYPRRELLAALEQDPARFSPNVLLRPVVESSVFPTLGYVGGPSEIAYFAQVNTLFAELGILPPAVVPRFSATVIEPHVERVMESLRVTEDDLTGVREVVVDRLARRETPPELHDSLARLREALAKEFESLMGSAAEVDATLPAALGAIRNRALLLAAGTERKVLRAIKRGDRLAVERLDRVLNTIRPRGVPQERLLNVMPLLARYSSHFLREVELAIGDSWRFPDDG